MSHPSDEITTDPLFVGLTRPSTVWGIPFTAFVVELLTASIIFLAAGNPFYLAIAVPMHAVLYLMSAHDPGVFHSRFIWVKTIGLCRNTAFWGAASFSPLPTKKHWMESEK